MNALPDFRIDATGPVSRAVRARCFNRFVALTKHIRQLPYARPQAAQAVVAVLALAGASD